MKSYFRFFDPCRMYRFSLIGMIPHVALFSILLHSVIHGTELSIVWSCPLAYLVKNCFTGDDIFDIRAFCN